MQLVMYLYVLVRLLPGCSTARNLRSRLDKRFSISSKIDIDSSGDVDEYSASALIRDVSSQVSRLRFLNRIKDTQEKI